MVAERGPERSGAQHTGIHFKNSFLIFCIGAVGVGVVAEHEPEVGGAGAVKFIVGVADGDLRGSFGARIAEDPDTGGLRGAGDRWGHKAADECRGWAVFCARFGGFVVAAYWGVIIARVGLKLGELNDVFGADAFGLGGQRELIGGETVAHARRFGAIGAPADDHTGRSSELEVGPAENRGSGVRSGGGDESEQKEE